MAKTYEPIATNTLTSNTATVTFSSISSAYTDLVIVIADAKNLTGNSDVFMRFNSDSGTNYSGTMIYGDGSAAASTRRSSSDAIIPNYFNFLNSSASTQFNINIQNYSNSTTYKTVLWRDNRAAQAVEAGVGLWRNTAAITSIVFTLSTSSYATGTTFTLYGIKSA